jgi:DNA repair photolyase
LRCEFCNTRSLSEWVGDTPERFSRRITVLRNSEDLLIRELAAPDMAQRGERVLCVGGDSDPYQPAEERFEVTRDVLKVCLDTGHPVIIQTRQELILRDIDLIETLAEKGLVNVLIAMQTSIDGIRNKVELGVTGVAERFRMMRMLSTRNIPVGLVLSPIMPELTDDESMLDETIRRAGDAGAKWVVAQVLDLKGSAGVKVHLFLESYAAALVPRYEELYENGENGRIESVDYARRITEEIVPGLAAKHGLVDFGKMLTSGRDPKTCLVRK